MQLGPANWRISGLFGPILAALAAATSGETATHSLPHVLERPAVITGHAAQSVLLAITAAGKRLIAVGERGIVVWSDDSGRTWVQANVPVSVTLTGVFFVDPENGWAVGHGGIVLHSADGGRTWAKQLDGVTAAQLALDHVRQMQVSRKRDKQLSAEITNAERLVREGADKPFLDVYFQTSSAGYVVGAFGAMLHTVDGGQTWRIWSDRIDNPAAVHLYAIRGAGSELCVIGERGLVFRSTDDGQTFHREVTPYTGTFFGEILGASGHPLLIFGLKGHAEVFGSGGTPGWRDSATGTASSISAGTQLRDGTLLIGTAAGDFRFSSDGGESFAAAPIAPAWPVTGVVQAADGSVVAVGLGGVRRFAWRGPGT